MLPRHTRESPRKAAKGFPPGFWLHGLRRAFYRARRRWIRLAFLSTFVLLLLDLHRIINVIPPEARVPPTKDPSTHPTERIFIASMHWNNERILRSHWNAAVLDLARYYGPENVYVSISESGSWDGTKDAIRELDRELGNLGVERTIVMHETTHADEMAGTPGPGWIWTKRGKQEIRRIPYLAGIRNEVMEPLRRLAQSKNGEKGRYFDKILWLNDVVFKTEDVTTLLATRGGEYSAACSIDFAHPERYYDTFVLRDDLGAEPITGMWPYFLSAKAKKAVRSNTPVAVKSCWTGMSVFQAEPFYNDIKFRGISDSLANYHLEGSECCLIHVDNPLTAVDGVWLNTNVRVAYNPRTYDLVHPISNPWPSPKERLHGIWSNRLEQWLRMHKRVHKRFKVWWRMSRWRKERKGHADFVDEKGEHCLVDEMQVLVHNGWGHV